MSHKFTSAKPSLYAPGVLRYAAAGEYEIRCLVPAPTAIPGPAYRIKHVAEKHEACSRTSNLVETIRSVFT